MRRLPSVPISCVAPVAGSVRGDTRDCPEYTSGHFREAPVGGLWCAGSAIQRDRGCRPRERLEELRPTMPPDQPPDQLTSAPRALAEGQDPGPVRRLTAPERRRWLEVRAP